jgi:hypothetical protein
VNSKSAWQWDKELGIRTIMELHSCTFIVQGIRFLGKNIFG